jgi:hypothetical protein
MRTNDWDRGMSIKARRTARSARSTAELSATEIRTIAGEPEPGEVFRRDDAAIHFDRAERLYAEWPGPICIISDGPYGVSGFPGDENRWSTLADWYEPHIEAWTQQATPQTTLWFWNTEVGWASVHPLFVKHGWNYRSCNIWDKGMSHVAGNANTQTLRKFPVVSEVCAHYVKAAVFRVGDKAMTMQEWLRHEWLRSRLALRLANHACEVLNAATRKYLTADHLWYYPPPEAFVKLADHANRYGAPEGRPYFSVNGRQPLSAEEWSKLRAKFECPVGVTNVWREPQVSGPERIQGARNGMSYKFSSLHGSQKPLRFIEMMIRACTEEGDVIWEPFGGLCPAAVVAHRLLRKYRGAEIVPEFYRAAAARLAGA